MYINNIRILNLRNHLDTYIEFNKGINIICGLNGVGKTTILEAISICCFSKSFQPTADKELINKNENFYNLKLNATSDFASSYNINASYKLLEKKKFSGTLGDNLLPKDLIGEIPIVILNPDYKNITFGSPQNRRDFIDKVISQSNKLYFEKLIKFKKALKQKNNLLNLSKKDKFIDFSQIDVWSEILIDLSTYIIQKRIEFIDNFKKYFFGTYYEISNSKEEIDLFYAPNGIDDFEITLLKENLIKHFQKYRLDEFKRGISLVGPQKDDLKFIINGGIAKDYASQGQHKSLLISLKFAEFHFLKDKHNETPILLLDDIFAELDETRSNYVFELIQNHNVQTFITTTEFNKFQNIKLKEIENKMFYIENGKIITK